MRNPRHAIVSLAIALATAAVALLIGIDAGPALILGAVGGIIASVAMQRQAANRSGASTGSEEPADIQASLQTAGLAVSQFQSQAAGISDPGVRELAVRLGSSLESVLRLAQPTDRSGVAPLILDQLVEPATALLTDYLWLQKRPETPARDAMAKIASRDLPAADHAARQVIATLERPGPVDVNAIRRAVDFQFSFGGETVSTSPEMWGNRQQLVEEAERHRDG
jgi:hypothetical protein